MPLYHEPVPTLGQVYPTPLPRSDVAAAADGAWGKWRGGLGPARDAIGAHGPDLDLASAALGTARAGLATAADELGASGLAEALSPLQAVLQQPSPFGTIIPFAVSVPQLPTEIPPSAGLADWLRAQIDLYASNLMYYLSNPGGVVLPPEVPPPGG